MQPLEPVRGDQAPTGQLRGWEHQPDTHGLVQDISDALVCRNNDEFFMTDLDGEMAAGLISGLGYYFRDCRHLSEYSLRLNGQAPLVLASAAQSGFSQEQVLGNRRALHDGRVVGRGTIELRRTRYLSIGLTEHLEITNHNVFPISLRITYCFDADFKDIFEIRGHHRIHPGEMEEPETGDNYITYHYTGADGVHRQTILRFQTAPGRVSPHEVEYDLTLEAHETRSLDLRIMAEESPSSVVADFEAMRADYQEWRQGFAKIHTDNEHFNTIVRRSLDDLRTLWTVEGDGSFFAAGVPWFATLFGRDTIIAAMEVLVLRPDLAKQCLKALAKKQSHVTDESRAQEPGKILHEARKSELNLVDELPYQAYYGSVDATPLFLLLAAEYYAWSADLETARQLKPNILDAIAWIRKSIATSGGPYLRYDTDAFSGLRNQAWKDSDDAIVHEDGSLCDGSIAMAEVQGYVYAAFTRLQAVLEALGEQNLGHELAAEAEALRTAFATDFWQADSRRLGMALDGRDTLSAVPSSNAGQTLWGGILDETRADAVRASLLSPDMFSGWGIRTLSSRAQSYFPLGYHVGTVWPHDNALIAAGLKRYGFDAEVIEVFTGLFDAAQQFPSSRLPELFGGQDRSPYLPPVPYPVACRPQAWAAGALLYILQSTLGLTGDAPNGRLVISRPRLPFWLNNLQLMDLRVGKGTVNLRFERRDEMPRVIIESAKDVRVVVVD